MIRSQYNSYFILLTRMIIICNMYEKRDVFKLLSSAATSPPSSQMETKARHVSMSSESEVSAQPSSGGKADPLFHDLMGLI